MSPNPLDFELLFEASPDVLLVLLPDAPRYTMVTATRARLEATHMTLDDLKGKGLFELFPDNPDDPSATGAANLRASLDRVCSTRAPDTMAVQKYDIRGPDGTFETKYWSPKNLPVLSPRGELLYIFHRVEDVTELVRASETGEELRDRNKEMEREVIRRSRELSVANGALRDANTKLGALDTAKTAFFNNVSHELRTPLTLMLGPLEDALLDVEERAGPRQRPRLELAFDNARRLLGLVTALLDFARAEAGRLQARYAPIDLARVTAEQAGMFHSAMDRAGIRMVVDCPALSEWPYVDRSMWEKIVPNLVSNALKFTSKGEILVRLREVERSVLLEVTDTGIGIPSAEVGRVFERFYRVEGNAGPNQGGTGIGLSLVRELVHLHGGEISVESKVGTGSTFRVRIPKGSGHLPPEAVSASAVSDGASIDVDRYVEPPSDRHLTQGREDPVAAPSIASAARILVVDDNADLRRYIAGLLEPTYRVRVAGDGEAALEEVCRELPDLIVSDVMMPRLDGFGLVRRLRADPRMQTIPVILLSARAGEQAAVDGLDSGSDDYLVKPFSGRELLARVRTHLELSRMRRRAADVANELAETRAALLSDVERKNRELEAFSYSVSHDLRAPLRAIDGFSEAIQEEAVDRLSPADRRNLHRVRAATQRMNELIDGLLELSSVEREDLSRAPVDLSRLADEVVKGLRDASPGREVSVKIQPQLQANADARLLRVVLENLLGNAWKFTGRTDGAEIQVGASLAGERLTYYVRDNGAGFDASSAERLFQAFQRMHAQTEFSGTGIGLATVQRVIERHGGGISAESQRGKGATFSFWLGSAGKVTTT